MDVLVPFDAVDPKRRLGSMLSRDERAAFAETMLRDVLAALQATRATPRVLATAPIELDVPVLVDQRPLSEAINDEIDLAELPLGIVMADLPLLTPAALERLFAADGEVVLVPGIGGGTNAIVVRSAGFAVDYHGWSFRDHRMIAEEAGLRTAIVDSYRLSLDVDEPADLVEVLLHGEGTSADWLREHGFAVSTDDEGRVDIDRTSGD